MTFSPGVAAEPPMRRRNIWGFGLGTLGRDMVATLVTMFLLVYLTEVVQVSNATLGAITVVLVVMRLFDAVNDPVMGYVVDNTRTRWGKFKPWIAGGALAWAGATLLMFSDWGLTGPAFVVVFIGVYLLWEVAYTVNDISYWGMLPSLSRRQPERERIGVVARVCANVGVFALVVALVPVTEALTDVLGSAQRAWFTLAAAGVVVMLAFQAITLLTTRQRVSGRAAAHTPLRELLRVIVGNDQLLWVTLAMVAFMTGYTITTSLGLYYFTYIYGQSGMYSVFAAILGITQITGLLVFPLVSARLSRRRVHLLATGLCVAGYTVFLVAGSTMVLVGLAGVLLFSGQAFIQLLMLMFIADSVEYGQWKLGRRNESVTFSLQPFIYKAASALGSGAVGATLILSGINDAEGAADITAGGAAAFKVAMMVLPMLLVVLSWLILARRYRLDEATYASIVAELRTREAALGEQGDAEGQPIPAGGGDEG
ncbi:glycoside-pentoside-hexuronide (GPH):cation symporter [Ruania zhangjianzhongii]|uniref:glycoside-pentoside-hexuronide (GPH):cation symporter n=1 Tax=Ruania zhangjianzhongii TaxID=2603206 RepID=UPI001AEF8BF9|nr:glycoside-pentoside-hexuronide (GPH):cation symporter [Ruania zhangjianzhongii]